MSKFTVLTGSALGKAIAGQGKAVATFTAREHQLAYSALNHVELHNDVKYLNALYEVTPANYRKGLVSWSVGFGKVKFDQKTRVFEYAKGKASDMTGALEVAPANYEKVKGESTREKAAFDEVKYLERVLAKLEEEGASLRVIQSIKGALTLAKTPVAPQAPAAKPAKAKTVNAKPQQDDQAEQQPLAA